MCCALKQWSTLKNNEIFCFFMHKEMIQNANSESISGCFLCRFPSGFKLNIFSEDVSLKGFVIDLSPKVDHQGFHFRSRTELTCDPVQSRANSGCVLAEGIASVLPCPR